jgi:hypothetical protein
MGEYQSMSRTLRCFLMAGFTLGCGTESAEPDEVMTTVSDTTSTSSGSGSGETSGSTSTTDDPDPSTGVGTTEEEGDASADDTGGEGWMPYQACMMGECPEEADECHVYVAHVAVHYCTVFCDEDDDCPAPSGGAAEAVCDPYLTQNYCALDCSGGKTCPAGMGCFDVTLVDQSMVMRCGWVDE